MKLCPRPLNWFKSHVFRNVFFSLITSAFIATGGLQAEPRHALVIGVSEYTGDFADLPGITGENGDVDKMSKKLTELGFAVTKVSNPTNREAWDAIRAFTKSLDPKKDTALFYFSGHGGQYLGKQYLIPKNAQLNVLADLEESAISLQKVINGMEEKSRVHIAFLDCCRNDLATKGPAALGSPEVGASIKGGFIGFAARSGVVALPSAKGSIYTMSLVEEMGAAGMIIQQMHTRVVAKTLKITKQYYGTEYGPSAVDQLAEDFYFVPQAGGKPSPKVQTTSMKTSSSPTPVPLPTPSKGFINTLGMTFLPVPGIDVLFCEHETRVRDYAVYASAKSGVNMEWKDLKYKGHKQTSEHPVINVSWEDAKAFCQWLSAKEGKTYRLPTDHEWSMAVGIGAQENASASPKDKHEKIAGYPWGVAWPPPTGAGNFYTISGYRDSHPFTAPVKSYTVGKYGLYDMSGNAVEWCEDLYLSKQTEHETQHILRGGSWEDSDARLVEAAYRNRSHPTARYSVYGFRCVVSSAR